MPETEPQEKILQTEKLPVKESSTETRLPVKQKQELLPYEKENYSTIEKAVIELQEELANLSELRDSIEHSFENKISAPCTMKLRIFAPPADGKNHPFGEGDDWLYNYYAELSSLPEIRLEYEPVVGADDEYKFD